MFSGDEQFKKFLNILSNEYLQETFTTVSDLKNKLLNNKEIFSESCYNFGI